MAFDGIAISAVAKELSEKITGGKIDKIYQPENDEIIIALRSSYINYKLLLTCNPSFPRIHLTNNSKDNPSTAPVFCMVLRKHLTGGKILSIKQINFDRIINIVVEAFNEMGDLVKKTLVIEIMGKHSNIILLDDSDSVIDSIKHISYEKSSVRPIFPGRKYTLPPSDNRINPCNYDFESFKNLAKKNNDLASAIYRGYFGISPVAAKEICFVSDIFKYSDDDSLKILYENFFKTVNSEKREFYIYYDNNKRILDFSCFEMPSLAENKKEKFSEINELLDFYYKEKDIFFRVNQKSLDIKKIIENNIDRCKKKSKLYANTLENIKDRDRLKLYGELITSNIYAIEKGISEFTCQNFYDENLANITIKLDPMLTASENAQKYFKKYNKEKRTFEALKKQITDNENELDYLKTVLISLNSCFDEADIREIREELYNEGYLKKKKNAAKKEKKSKPMAFISSDGFNIYVGKNNLQNDFLTMKFAHGNDIWLHTENIPGSHVIIKTNSQEIPESTIFEAASLAAYYSQASLQNKVSVVFTNKKNVKKPTGAKPGMVIYNNYKTILIDSDHEIIEKIKKI